MVEYRLRHLEGKEERRRTCASERRVRAVAYACDGASTGLASASSTLRDPNSPAPSVSGIRPSADGRVVTLLSAGRAGSPTCGSLPSGGAPRPPPAAPEASLFVADRARREAALTLARLSSTLRASSGASGGGVIARGACPRREKKEGGQRPRKGEKGGGVAGSQTFSSRAPDRSVPASSTTTSSGAVTSASTLTETTPMHARASSRSASSERITIAATVHGS